MEVLETQETIGSAVADPKVLNKDTAATLTSMLKSKDEGDHKMAQLILNQIDIQKSIYWIWRISKDSYNTYRMVNLRTKASRKFRDDCELFTIASKQTSDFLKWLINKSWLTPEIYSYLLDDIIEDLRFRLGGMSCAKMFNVAINLKDEYKQYDPNNILQLETTTEVWKKI